MKEKLFRAKVLVPTIIIIAGIIAAIFGINYYNNYKEEQRANEIIATINSSVASFDEIETTNDKIVMYNDLNDDYNKYIKNDDCNEKVKKEYEKNLAEIQESIISDYKSIIEANSIDDLENTEDKDIKKALENLLSFNSSIKVNTDSIEEINTYTTEIDTMIADMRKYFADSYDTTISKNTIKNVEKVDDKEKLEKAIENLKKLKKSLNNDSNITIENDETLDNYTKTIDKLIKSYENRIDEIKKAEEEQKEVENNSLNYNTSDNYDDSYNNDYSNSSNYSDSGSSSNNDSYSSNSNSSSDDSNSNNNSSNEWHGGLHHTYTNTITGITSYFYNDGYCYNDSGAEGNWKDLQNY